jgi:hypothetical protein
MDGADQGVLAQPGIDVRHEVECDYWLRGRLRSSLALCGYKAKHDRVSRNSERIRGLDRARAP